MKVSVIFPYRNRRSHLDITIPIVRNHLKSSGADFELIVVEQGDNNKFRRGNLLNVGTTVASGDVLVFHDIDYVPDANVDYFDVNFDVFLPVKRVVFTDEFFVAKPIELVPRGYQHFRKSVDDNFFGGVLSITRKAFDITQGFNWKMKGWGREDEMFRDICYAENLNIERSPNGLFYALDHVDSGPDINTDSDFRNNIQMSNNWKQYRQFNVTNQPNTIVAVTPEHNFVDIWIKATDFDPYVEQYIQTTKFNFDEGDE